MWWNSLCNEGDYLTVGLIMDLKYSTLIQSLHDVACIYYGSEAALKPNIHSSLLFLFYEIAVLL